MAVQDDRHEDRDRQAEPGEERGRVSLIRVGAGVGVGVGGQDLEVRRREQRRLVDGRDAGAGQPVLDRDRDRGLADELVGAARAGRRSSRGRTSGRRHRPAAEREHGGGRAVDDVLRGPSRGPAHDDRELRRLLSADGDGRDRREAGVEDLRRGAATSTQVASPTTTSIRSPVEPRSMSWMIGSEGQRDARDTSRIVVTAVGPRAVREANSRRATATMFGRGSCRSSLRRASAAGAGAEYDWRGRRAGAASGARPGGEVLARSGRCRPTRSMKISSIDGSAIRKFVTRSPRSSAARRTIRIDVVVTASSA